MGASINSEQQQRTSSAKIKIASQGSATIGSVAVGNRYTNYVTNIYYVINSSTGIKNLGKELISLNEDYDRETSLKYFSSGTLREAIDNTGVLLSKRREEYIDRAFAAGIANMDSPTKKDLDSVLSIVKSLVAGYQAHSLSDNIEIGKWSIDNGTANEIAQYAYNDTDLEKIRKKQGINDGVLSVLDSLKYYTDNDLIDLTVNTTNLIKSLKSTSHDYARLLIIGRIIVNSNLLSDNRTAFEYLEKVEFDKIIDLNMKAKLLDYAATLNFNSVPANKFARFDCFDMAPIKAAWKRAGVETDDNIEDSNIIERFGLHIFTVQQIRYFGQCRELESGANLEMSLRYLRDQMIEDFIRSLDLSHNTSHAVSIAKDFFGSLQRPAFHALSCGDFEHLKYILDIYHGRNIKGDKDGLNRVRGGILATAGRNRQWMMLLDIASKKRHDIDGAIKDFNLFLKKFRILSEEPIIKNHAILRTVPFVARGLGLDVKDLISKSNIVGSAKINELNLHQAYACSIVDAMNHDLPS